MKVVSWLPLLVIGSAILLVGFSNWSRRNHATKEAELAEWRELVPILTEIEDTWAVWDAEDKLAEARENAYVGQAETEAEIGKRTDKVISRSLARIDALEAKESALRASLVERYGIEPVQRAEARIRARRSERESEELRKRYQE